jgi:cardiolipin synthase A/B
MQGSGIDAPGPTADADLSGTTAISVIVEPDGMNAQQLVDALNGAQTSIDMTMYEISNDDVVNALVARAKAHVTVLAVLDSSSTNKSFNTDAYNKINSAGGSAVWSNTAFTYTHEKTIIIDNKVAWIMTMNATASAPSSNREYLAIDTDANDIAEATAIFTADHALQSINPNGALVVANTNARSQLVGLINTATTTLDLEGEEFSDLNQGGIVQAVQAAAHRGVTVHIVVGNSDPDAEAIADATGAGAKVVVTGPTSDNGTMTDPYIHAKAVVIDCAGTTCKRGFVGSENFSAGSLGYNRELGVIFETASELAKVKATIDIDFAAGTPQ